MSKTNLVSTKQQNTVQNIVQNSEEDVKLPKTPTEDKKPVIDYVSINDINDDVDDDLDYTIICRKKKTQTSPKNLSKRSSKY